MPYALIQNKWAAERAHAARQNPRRRVEPDHDVGILNRSVPRPLNSITFSGVLDLPAVPEPATWISMIAGFGFAGAALRRRRAVFAR